MKRVQNRAAIRAAGHKVVYLRCDAAELNRRIEGDPKTRSTRPHLTALGGGLAEVEKLLAEREPLYREITDIEIDVAGLAPGQVVDEIMRRIVPT